MSGETETAVCSCVARIEWSLSHAAATLWKVKNSDYSVSFIIVFSKQFAAADCILQWTVFQCSWECSQTGKDMYWKGYELMCRWSEIHGQGSSSLLQNKIHSRLIQDAHLKANYYQKNCCWQVGTVVSHWDELAYCFFRYCTRSWEHFYSSEIK